MSEKKNFILDSLLVIAKGRKTIFYITFIASIGAVLFSLLVTPKWKSTAVVQPVMSSSSLDLSNISGSLLSGLSSSLGMNNAEIEGQRIVAICYSRPFLEKMINEFDLASYFKTNKNKKAKPEEIRDNTIKEIKKKMLFVSYDDGVGFLNVSIITKDKYLSPKIANYVVKELDYYNQHERLSKAKEKRILLEKRVDLIKKDINQTLNDLAEFQKKSHLLSVEDQTIGLMENYVRLESERIKNQITLDVLSLNFDKNDVRVQSKSDEVRIIKSYLKKLELSDDYSKYIVSLDKLPEYAKEYIQIEAKLKINQTVLEYIYPQLEIAKLEESKDTTTFDIIEEAVPAGRRAWPKRAFLCVAFFFSSILFSTGFVLLKDKVDYLMNQDDHKQKIQNIKKILFSK